MTFDKDLTPQQQIDRDIKPIGFWIGSEGEVSHSWADGRETYAKSESDRDLYTEFIDNREAVLYRMWDDLQPLRGLFRFWCHWPAGGEPKLGMTIEYCWDDSEHTKQYYDCDQAYQEHWPAIEAEALHLGAVPSDMAGAYKYHWGLDFNVFGTPFAQVAALQYKWFTFEEPHHDFVLSIM